MSQDPEFEGIEPISPEELKDLYIGALTYCPNDTEYAMLTYQDTMMSADEKARTLTLLRMEKLDEQQRRTDERYRRMYGFGHDERKPTGELLGKLAFAVVVIAGTQAARVLLGSKHKKSV